MSTMLAFVFLGVIALFIAVIMIPVIVSIVRERIHRHNVLTMRRDQRERRQEVEKRQRELKIDTLPEAEHMAHAQTSLSYMHDDTMEDSYYQQQLDMILANEPSQGDPTQDSTPAEDTTSSASHRDMLTEWQSYVTLHKELNEKLWQAETDWDTIFYYPAINDHTVPETQDMFMAQVVAQRISDTPPTELTSSTMVAELPYPKAVLALQKAWNIAWANAQKIAQSNLTDAERKDIKQIITLLRKVEDGAATESEKIVAYDRIDVLMRNLRNITIPERKKTILAAERRQALTTGTTDDMQDAPQEGSERREREAQDASALLTDTPMSRSA